MIAPLKYCADHRPYFTIHDSEFKEYTTDSPTPPAVILGVTNPFFAKTLQHWPHIIRISNGSNSGKFYDAYLLVACVFKIWCFRRSKIQNQEVRKSEGAGLQAWRLHSVQTFSAEGQDYFEEIVQGHSDEAAGRGADRALETSLDRANRELYDPAREIHRDSHAATKEHIAF